MFSLTLLKMFRIILKSIKCLLFLPPCCVSQTSGVLQNLYLHLRYFGESPFITMRSVTFQAKVTFKQLMSHFCTWANGFWGQFGISGFWRLQGGHHCGPLKQFILYYSKSIVQLARQNHQNITEYHAGGNYRIHDLFGGA